MTSKTGRMDELLADSLQKDCETLMRKLGKAEQEIKAKDVEIEWLKRRTDKLDKLNREEASDGE